MKTGLTKKQKITEVYFNERDEFAEVYTHNTELKKRLAAYANFTALLTFSSDCDRMKPSNNLKQSKAKPFAVSRKSHF